MPNAKKKSVKRDSNLLSESIAEAQTLVTVATENARMQLEEAFTPHIQSILSQRIQNEVDGSDEEDEFGDITEPTDEEPTDDLEGDEDMEGGEEDEFEGGEEDFEGEDDEFGGEEEDEEEFEGDEEDTEGGEEFDDEEDIDFDDEDLESEPEEDASEPTEDDMEMEPEEEPAPEEDEDDKDIQEIINELEAGLDDDEEDFSEFEDGEEVEPSDEELEAEPDLTDMEDEEDVYEETEMGDYGEDIDIESILREVEMEESGEMEDESIESLKTENAVLAKRVKKLTKDLNEHIKVLKYTKSKLNEVNLLNSKLFFTNKLFKKNNLTNNEKMKIIESFDRARSLNEVKLLYTTLATTYKAAKSQNIVESKKYASANKITSKIAGGASKPMKSTKPSKPITEEVEHNESADALYESLVIIDNDESKKRLQSLANIGKKKRK